MSDDDHTTAARPRRSVLYLPGANERALAKAVTLPADAVILDLEDAVAPAAKPAARSRVVAAAGVGDLAPREVTIRVNGIGSPWHREDVVAVATSGADAVVVPKVGRPDDVDRVATALDAAGAPGDLAIWAMVETPGAVLDARAIATSSPRLAAFVLGTNDLATELGTGQVGDRGPLLTALSLVVLAARATGTIVLDGVFNDLSDDEGFVAECHQGRVLGFDGKTVIHPRQLAAANTAFAPTADELAHAERIIAAFAEAEAAGLGVVTVDGRMVENLHVAQARRDLDRAAAIDRLEQSLSDGA